MLGYPNREGRAPLSRRILSAFLSILFIYYLMLPDLSLFAQDYRVRQQDFQSFQQSLKNLDRYVDRAERMNDAAAWNNYIELGIATEFVAWEREALDLLQQGIDRIEEQELNDSEREAALAEAREAFMGAREQWEGDAAQMQDERRGEFRARASGLDLAEVDESVYVEMVAAAEAAAWNEAELSLNAFDAALAGPHQNLELMFEAELANELSRARNEHAGLGLVEQQAFENELASIEEGLRREFEIRDNFYIVRARNRMVALQRNDDLNAKLAAEETSAEAVGEDLLADAQAQIEASTRDMLAAAVADVQSTLSGAEEPDLSSVENNWESQIEAVIESGLSAWQRAEEDLYAGQLAWMRETKTKRETGAAIWEKNYEELKTARETWLEEVQVQVDEGRLAWDAKFEEFAANRAAAEERLAEYITLQQQRWGASSRELADIVQGGSSALLEAQDALRYYDQLLAADNGSLSPEVREFYGEERNRLNTMLVSFGNILTESEGVLEDRLHSDQADTGLLVDRRRFARNLPVLVGGLATDDFRDDLTSLMAARGEDFVLYRRDIETLIDDNQVFATRARELQASSDFDPAAAVDLETLREQIQALARKYDDHRLALLAILDRERPGLGETDRLDAVRSELLAWLADNADENQRLRLKTIEYFEGGAAGYYLTGNENDPYLMSEAEVQWELLRRERNYLAKRLESARAVKNYADLAYQHEAGLELAAVTAERAEMTRAASVLKEIAYRLIRGDFTLDPAAATDPAARIAERDRLIAEHDLDWAYLVSRESGIQRELNLLDGILTEAGQPDPDFAISIDALGLYLEENIPDIRRGDHPLETIRGKLLAYREATSGTVSAQEKRDRLNALSAGVTVTRDMLAELQAAYDFTRMRADRDALIGLIAGKNLNQHQAGLDQTRAAIEANAALLRDAAAELESAQEEYRRARVDFEALRSGNAADLLNAEIRETSGGLAQVLNRMVQIEDIPGLSGVNRDAREAAELRFLHDVSEGRRLSDREAGAREMLVELEGLELAKARRAVLDEILADNDPSPVDPVLFAEKFLDREDELILPEDSQDSFESHYLPLSAMDRLKTLKQQYDTLAAEASPAAGPDLEERRAQLASYKEEIRIALEGFFTGIRAEENTRRKRAQMLLNPGADPAPTALARQAAEEERQLNEYAGNLAADAAASLEIFLNANREKTYARILKTINDQIAGAAVDREVRRSDDPFALTPNRPTPAERDYKILAIIRDWVLANRGAIEMSGTDPGAGNPDPRSVAVKWDALLEGVSEKKAAAALHANFEASRPASAADVRVAAYRAGRETLRDNLNAVLASADGDLYDAYRNLSAEDRDLISAYSRGPEDLAEITDPIALRGSLSGVRGALLAELAALRVNYRAILDRDEARQAARELGELETEFAEITARGTALELTAAADENERDRLQNEYDLETDPGIRDELSDRIEALEARIAATRAALLAQTPRAETVRERYLELQNLLRELQQPGAAVFLGENARAGLRPYYEGMTTLSGAARTLVAEDQPDDPALARTTTREKLGAILGIFQTDEYGKLRRDAAGNPRVTQEFRDLNIPGVSGRSGVYLRNNLDRVIAGGMRGDHLADWAGRLTEWTYANRNAAEPEILGAVELVQESLIEYRFAEEILNTRDQSTARVLSDARALESSSAALAEKLVLFNALEEKLQQALVDAEREKSDPVNAALAVLDAADAPVVLRLFDGFDVNGDPDGVSDADLARRAAELSRLHEHLRDLRDHRTALTIQEEFAAERAALFGTLNTGRTPEEVVAAHPDMSDALRDELKLKLAQIDRQASRDRDLEIETSIADLMAAYAGRGSSARAAITPVLDGLADGADVIDARAEITTKTEELLPGGSFASLRREIYALLNQASTTPELKSELGAYLRALRDPPAEELALLEDEIATRELRAALVRSDTAERYVAEDYPEELREFVLVRAYRQAADRYAEFNRMRASDRADQKAAAVLNLAGISGDAGRKVLYADFDAYLAANPLGDFHASRVPGGPGSLNEYLQSYLRDRNTDATRLPPGGPGDLYTREAHREYLRISDDAVNAGGLALLDEDQYFSEFRDYLFVAKFEDFAARTGYVHAGATRAERETALRAAIADFLADPFYVRSGMTMGDRLPAEPEREKLFATLFVHLEFAGTLTDHLPALADRAAAGTLDDPLRMPVDELPPELLAIPDYATADYRLLATAGVSRESLARVEVLEQAGREDLSMYLPDDELDRIITRAGHGSLPAAASDALRSLLRRVNLQQRGGSADEAQALRNLRRERAYARLYPDEAAREELSIFLAANTNSVNAIEEKFFAALEKRNGDLRDLARERRGDLLLALLHRATGQPDPLHSSSTALIQSEIDLLSGELFAALSGAERDLLELQSAAVRDIFDFRSAQELVDSGLLESIENAAGALWNRTLDDDALALVRDQPGMAARALVESYYRSRGLSASISPEAAGFISAVPGLGATINQAVANLDPALAGTLRAERVLIERYFALYQESAADRRALRRVLTDPAALNPDLSLSFTAEIQKEKSLLAVSAGELAAALSGLVSEHGRFLAEKNDVVAADREMARRLLEFAEVRGRFSSFQDSDGTTVNISRFMDSTFLNYRTYAGIEEQAWDGVADAPVLDDRRVGNGNVEGLLNGDWRAVLLSDAAPADPGEDRGFRTVSDNKNTTMDNGLARRLYYENIANNYLEATTNLNRALNRIVSAGDLAEDRLSRDAAELTATFRARYDVSRAGAVDLEPSRTIVQKAATDGAVYSSARTAQARASAVALRGQFDSAGADFAQAGRRNLLMNQQMTQYLDRVFRRAEQRVSTAQAEFETLQAQEQANRERFANQTTAHIEAMNTMAEWLREFQVANDEFEIRRAVREFAETPYLFATAQDSYGSEEDGVALQSDALAEYELARAALEDVQGRLSAAAQNVAIQDRLPEFAAIIDLLKNGSVAQKNTLKRNLTAAERDELLDLRDRKYAQNQTLVPADEARLLGLSQREMYARHATLIQTRSKYISHEMQAVRLQKASEIIDAEVQRRQAMADLTRQRFEQLLAEMFGSFAADEGATRKDWEGSRNAVYMRLAQMVDNDANFYNEYRTWYQVAYSGQTKFGGDKIVDSFPTKSWGQQNEKNTAQSFAGALDSGIRNSLTTWISAGGLAGEVGSGFSGGFVPVYSSFLDSIGNRDEKAHIKSITFRNWVPVAGLGAEMVAIGMAAGWFQPWLLLLIPAGTAMIIAAVSKMNAASKELAEADRLMEVQRANSRNQAAAPDLEDLQTAMERYAEALGALEYFTKVPDLQTLKERSYLWGRRHDDETPAGQAEDAKLYRIADRDLRYLLDQKNNGQPRYVDRNGQPEPLTAREKSDALDVTGQRQEVEYTDAFGNRYNPDTVGEKSESDLTLTNGFYEDANGQKYVRIKKTDHDGSARWVFARRTNDGVTREAYNMAEILKALALRNREIAEDYRGEYYAAGAALTDGAGAANRTFVLNERDATLGELFARSSVRRDGGREFSGYGTVYGAYSANGEAIFAGQLDQRVTVQRSQWDLRERELREARESWENKINTIMERGRRSWGDSENRFLAEWRRWEREMDQEEEAGQKVWDERVEDHFTARDEWVNNIRSQSAEITIEKVVGDAADQLNAQLALARSSMGANIEALNKIGIINQAVDEMKRSLPSAGARKRSINLGIDQFNVALNAENLLGGNFSVSGGLAGKFQKQMQEFQKSMKVLANVQMFEQFRKFQDTLVQQINTQNQAMEDRTATAALSSGFQRQGGVFTKSSGLSNTSATVHAYRWFDARAALNLETEKRGMAVLEGEGLVNYLKDKSGVEVETFFDIQRLALQTAMKAIMGSAHPGAGTRDPEVIGQFWAWAGMGEMKVERFANLDSALKKSQSSMEAAMVQSNFDLVTFRQLMSRLDTENLNHHERKVIVSTLSMLQREIQRIKNPPPPPGRPGGRGSFAFQKPTPAPVVSTVLGGNEFRKLFDGKVSIAGFGELGGVSRRHKSAWKQELFAWDTSSTVRGFYPELQAGLKHIGEADQEWRENAAALDPFTAIVNSFNPVVMFASAKNNYDIQTEVYGMDKSDAFWGAAASFGKGLLSAAGTALLAATGVGATLATALSVGMIATSNMIHIGPDGKASFGVGADTVINTLFSVGTAAVGGYGGTGQLARVARAGIRTGLGVVQSGFQFNADGSLDGYDMDGGRFLGNSLISAVGSGLGGKLGKAAGSAGAGSFGTYLANNLGQRTATVLGEYYRYKNDQKNNYSALSNPGLDRLGQLAGGYAGQSIAATKWARERQQQNKDRTKVDAIRGLGYRRKQEWFGDLGTLGGGVMSGLGWLVGKGWSGVSTAINEVRSWFGYDRAAALRRDVTEAKTVRDKVAAIHTMKNNIDLYSKREVQEKYIELLERKENTMQEQLFALWEMRKSGLFDDDVLLERQDQILDANKVKVYKANGMNAYALPATGKRNGLTKIFNHGLRSNGTGALDAGGIIGDYYQQLEIEEYRKQGYDVLFVNSNGRANNAVSSATVTDQIGQYMADNPDQRFVITTHSRGAHDQLGVQSNAAGNSAEYARLIDEAKLDLSSGQVSALNKEIAARTNHVYMTSAALKGPVTGTIANLWATQLAAGFFVGNSDIYTGADLGDTSSPGQDSLTDSSQEDYFDMYARGRKNFTADVTMIGGSKPFFGGGGTSGEKIETFFGNATYFLSPSSWIGDLVSSPNGPGWELGVPFNDGAVGVDGQLNTAALERFSSGDVSAGRGQIQSLYPLNHGGTRDDPTMMGHIDGHMDANIKYWKTKYGLR